MAGKTETPLYEESSHSTWVESGSDSTQDRTYLYSIEYKRSSLTQANGELLQRTIKATIKHYQDRHAFQAARFVEAKAISQAPWNGLLTKNARLWRVQSGIFVKPFGPSPKKLSTDQILGENNQLPDPRYFAERMRKFQPPPIALCILPEERIRLFEPEVEIPNPSDAYFGSGASSVFMVPDVAQFLTSSGEIFAANIGSDFADEQFYIPRFSVDDFISASKSDLSRWFSTFGLFIAELPEEDGGVLIAANEPLDEFLSELGEVSTLS